MSLGPGVIGGMFAASCWHGSRHVRYREPDFVTGGLSLSTVCRENCSVVLLSRRFVHRLRSVSTSVDQRILAAFVGGALFLAALFLFSEFQFVRLEFDEKRIYTFSPWRKRRAIPWSAVCDDSFSKVNQWHVLKTRGYRSIRLSRLMSGLGTMREQWQKKCLQMEASSQAPPTHKSL